jgi:hypothetical protein
MNEPILTSDTFFAVSLVILFVAAFLAIGKYDHKKQH